MGKGPSIKQGTFDSATGLAGNFGDLAKSWSSAATAPINSATNYYSSLLQGGKGAQNVVAPYAMQISDAYRGQQRNLQNTMTAGGERNLAQAELGNTRARSIADLYANVQPMAAQNLASLGLNIGQLGTAYGQNANQGFGQLENYQGQRNQAKGAALGGIGMGLGGIAGLGLAPGGFLRSSGPQH